MRTRREASTVSDEFYLIYYFKRENSYFMDKDGILYFLKNQIITAMLVWWKRHCTS